MQKINPACAKLTIFAVDANEHQQILKLASQARVLCSFVGMSSSHREFNQSLAFSHGSVNIEKQQHDLYFFVES